jgi:hypothetical protein
MKAMGMDVMGWAANQAAQKKPNRLVSWLLSEAGAPMQGVLVAAALVVAVAI